MDLKMSESGDKVGRAENGFLNCQQCSRRYLTFVGLDYHAKLEHSGLNLKQIKEKQDSNLKQIEEKQDLNCVLNDVSAKIHPEFQEDQESFLKLNFFGFKLHNIFMIGEHFYNQKSHLLSLVRCSAGRFGKMCICQTA